MTKALLFTKAAVLAAVPLAGLAAYQLAAILLGCIASTASLALGIRFHKVNQKLSRAVAHDLLAQGVAMVVTTIFASLAYTGHLTDVGDAAKLAMRCAIFVPCIVTSFRLAVVVSQIERK